ncbi:hypothetical protein AX17_006878 [Amanita inopinata Kibby_2008]|nr:hypothetical protein AX17_006878 [Amanita inopinata Kibby_2008]
MPATLTGKKRRPEKSHAEASRAKKIRVVAKDVAKPLNEVQDVVRNKGKGKERVREQAKGKGATSVGGKRKRNLPVTMSRHEKGNENSDETEEEEDDDWESMSGSVLGEEIEGGVDNGSVETSDEKEMARVPGESKTSQEGHKAQRLLQAQRRAVKPHAELISQAKGVWSLARQKNIPTSERQAHVRKLMDVVRGHVKDVALKHDASRIVQTIVKHGGQKERNEIAVELKGQFRDLAQNKYSKFLVTKLIRLCPTHRISILSEFQSHVLRLLLHREASSVLADTFELYANAYERSLLLRDFYGKEATLFTVTGGSDADKERAKTGLRGILEGVSQESKKRILNAVNENLTSIFNNSDKGAVTHAIVHRALWEYVCVINEIADEAEKEKARREIFESCQDILAEMVHTKDGSRVVRDFLAEGNAKDRKQILKVLKPHVERMCLDDEAQLVLFTALDTIDDTKLLAKSVISPIISTLSTSVLGKNTAPLHATPQGRRALIHLLTPRTRRHFTPAQIALLAETDTIRDRTSKKPVDVREEEVKKAASPDLVSWVTETGESTVKETGGCLVIAEIMLYADGDKTSAVEALLRPLCATYPSKNVNEVHPIDLPHTSRLYKILLQGGHFNHSTHKIDYTPTWNAVRFAIVFANTIGEDVIVSMCTKGERGGAFVVAELCSTLANGTKKIDIEGAGNMDVIDEDLEEQREQARQLVKKWFTDEVKMDIQRREEMKGRKVLLESLAKL